MQTPEGIIKMKKTILEKYGLTPDGKSALHSKIGSAGGSKSRGGGFGYGEQGKRLAQIAGSKGGSKSRRGPAKYYTYKGKQMSITAIAREMGVARATAYKRLEIS